MCHPDGADPSGEESINNDGGGSPPQDSGSMDTGEPLSDGMGRIRLRWDALTGVPAHGFVVLATIDGDVEPTGAYCQVVLQQTIDIDGYIVPYVNGEDPCAGGGDPMEFESVAVALSMQVVAGDTVQPALCDERRIQVDGEVLVDYTGVEDCVQ